ncbi:S-adenosyl-L-methionine-dependentmethyltransferases superfamily protein [Striga asiatica]|uniref:S-adenosyl-L-methionine-dependentmethyltransferases superfamily protein n=1 Tax=Striga asiatica TaxID=4170 RepID=A0A5A7REJ8_STRAF|nr:S-adenosyl-L-methionine-dependentmethyltransferases superfamily protein [Striga asiatica]
MGSIDGFVMNGGDGDESYTRNSSFQKSAIDTSKSLIRKSIAEHLTLTSSRTFRIADLGCSAGPNTLFAVENILDAIKLKLSTHSNIPDNNNNSNNKNSNSQNSNNKNSKTSAEFHVYFNDHALNDFNTLFKSLPTERDYYASGVPGSFHGRIFPSGSLDVVHCSSALHWLSEAPRMANPGRAYCCGARDEVAKAYTWRHADDVSRFLEARAREVVQGGLVVLVIPARGNGVPYTRLGWSVLLDLLGECLVDLAREGIFDEEKVDEFNFPFYFTSPRELEQIIEQNGFFIIEKMEGLTEVKSEVDFIHDLQYAAKFFRATTSELIGNHFGHEILDRVFHTLFPQKLVREKNRVISSSPSIFLFVLLKRRPDILQN